MLKIEMKVYQCIAISIDYVLSHCPCIKFIYKINLKSAQIYDQCKLKPTDSKNRGRWGGESFVGENTPRTSLSLD